MKKVEFMGFRTMLFIGIILLSGIEITAQTLPASRSTDWTLAGLRDTVSPQNIILFSGAADNSTDHTTLLNSTISSAASNSIIQFDAGSYFFGGQINMKSNITLRGKGAGKTILRFDHGGIKQFCISATGSEGGDISLTADALKDSYVLTLASTTSINVGDYVRLIQDDADLVDDSWAERRTGQISIVTGKTATTLTLGSPLRMDFVSARNPRLRVQSPIENIGLECFTLQRDDQVTDDAQRNGTSKIKFIRTVNSWVKGVESSECNYAHFDALYGANLLVTNCYFHHAFEYGTGGRAYGVMLHFATSESRIENTVFDNLRHAMIMQAGANGNVFAYNSSTNARDENNSQDEDMVCHGNYPYLNLFEGNVCEAPSVDASHGENGPYNTYFRNRATQSAFNVTSGTVVIPSPPFLITINNSNQNFIGNEGSDGISGSGHQISHNSWQSSTGTIETSLAYASKPDFLTSAQFGGIGYPNFGTTAQNPASLRYAAMNYIDAGCGYHVWEGTAWRGNFVPDIESDNFNLRIHNGNVCQINFDVDAENVEVEPGGRLELVSGSTLNLDTIWLKSDASGYAQFLGDITYPAIFERSINSSGWHFLSVPLTGGDFSQIEKEVLVNYAGNPNNPSAFVWDPVTANYVAVSSNSDVVNGKGFNFYVSDDFVKNGKGINGDGKLPVKLTFKGNLVNGMISNSLGLGTASNATGDPTGWNMLYNPYPCSIDLDQLFNGMPANYQIGAHVFNPATGTFEIRATTAINNGNATTIAPGQALFVKLDAGADVNSGFYDFGNSVKTISSVSPLYKNQNEWIKINVASKSDTVRGFVYLDESGTHYYNEHADVSVMAIDSTQLKLSIIKQGNSKSRNLGIAKFDRDVKEIPLRIQPQGGVVSIRIEKNLVGKEFYLKNRLKNTTSILPGGRCVQISVEETDQFSLILADDYPEKGTPLAKARIENGFLRLFYESDFQFSTQASLFSISGQELFKSQKQLAHQKVEWYIGDLAPGVYLIVLNEGGVVNSIKITMQ